MNQSDTPTKVPLDGAVRALDPERAEFERWASPILGDSKNWRESGNCELAWQAWKAARAWVPMSQRKPKGGQLIVKRWKHGAVWAGTHDEGPKNESFHEWKAL